MRYIDTFRDNLWPNGKLRGPGVPRTTEEKIRTRDEANRKLSALVPGMHWLKLFQHHLNIVPVDLAANMIGRSNARRGARRMFAVLQNRRLNQHIAYTIIDEVSATLLRVYMMLTRPQGFRGYVPRIDHRCLNHLFNWLLKCWLGMAQRIGQALAYFVYNHLVVEFVLVVIIGDNTDIFIETVRYPHIMRL